MVNLVVVHLSVIAFTLAMSKMVNSSDQNHDFESSTRCSVFDFEQKLLEKLVRMEVKMEWIEREIGSVRHTANTEKARVNGELLRLSKRVEATSEALVPILFKASGLTKDADLRNSVIKFDKKVEINAGEGYDKSTGIFTAPIAGTYLMNMQLCVEPKKLVHAQILVGKRVIKHVEYKNEGSGYVCVTGSGVSVMLKDENAFVKCASNTDSGDIFHNEEYYTSFSGRKLF